MSQSAPNPAPLDLAAIRRQFPLLETKVHGKRIVYLDNAATAQKPQCVIDAVVGFYEQDCSNVHRGVHELSQRATRKFEDARESVARLVNAAEAREIVFTRGTTEAINLVAHAFGQRLEAGDEILLTEMEHHSNIVPWQLLAERAGVRLRVVPIDDRGVLMLDEYERLLGPRTRLVALVHTSNALGTRNPVEEMIALAHERDVPVLLDGAQAVVHESVDVQALDCDFLAFSGHKLYGPTGIGALYGKAALLESLPPWQGGGEMISAVSFEGTTFKGIPHRFEAGTPDIAGAIGLGAAAEFVRSVGADTLTRVDDELLRYTIERMGEIPDVRFIGTAPRKAGIISFLIDDIHAHDLGTILDRHGVAVRAGHHCAQPVMEHFGVPSTVRASFAVYNTPADVDAMVAAIHAAIELFPLMSDLRDLYQELILDHGKRPRNFHVMEPCDRKAEGYNPLCGDKLTVFVRYEDDRLEEISFSGTGCAISQASASLMTECLKGLSPQEVAGVFKIFHDLVTGASDSTEGLPPKLVAFAGVSEFPVRVKCATLPWHTLKAAIDRAAERGTTTVTTE